MSKPNVTEVPLHLEHMTPDPFPGDVATRPTGAPVIRELDRRSNDGIEVLLLWNETDDQVRVVLRDAKTGDGFEIEVEGREAHDAFHHPYAHAACRGITYRSADNERSVSAGP